MLSEVAEVASMTIAPPCSEPYIVRYVASNRVLLSRGSVVCVVGITVRLIGIPSTVIKSRAAFVGSRTVLPVNTPTAKWRVDRCFALKDSPIRLR